MASLLCRQLARTRWDMLPKLATSADPTGASLEQRCSAYAGIFWQILNFSERKGATQPHERQPQYGAVYGQLRKALVGDLDLGSERCFPFQRRLRPETRAPHWGSCQRKTPSAIR